MNWTRTFLLAGLAMGLAVLPVRLHAHSNSLPGASDQLPNGETGAPGDDRCTSCHTGSSLNSGGGSMSIAFADGTSTYIPGRTKHVIVTLADPNAIRWGFQLSPRQTSDARNKGAGRLTPTDGNTKLGADEGTLQWIEHTADGTRLGTTGSVTFEFDWAAPSSDMGQIDFYASGNAANGNRQSSGDKIYSAKATLTAAAAGGKPTIAQGGATNSFSALATRLGPGTWTTLYGTGLATTTRAWAGSDFSGNRGPTTLDGVSVSVNGKAAVLNYVSPGQVNIQIPTDAGTGSSTVVVTNANGTSDSYSVTLSQFAPGLLAPSVFNVGGKQYVVAQFADGTYVGRAGLISGLNFRPAHAGDTIIIYGVGFGPLQTPASTGQIVSGLDATANPVTFKFGSTTITPSYAGAAPGFVGAYQFNIVVPNNLPAGDITLDATVGGVSTGQTLYLTVQ